MHGLLNLIGRLLLLASSVRVEVEGESMAPALAGGDRLLVSRAAYRLFAPRFGEIVLLSDPSRPGYECIKRVVALPGETVRLDGFLVSIVNTGDQPAQPADGLWTLGPREYFVAGDNLAHSTDSRSYGPVDRSALLGRAWYRYRSVSGAGGALS